MHRRTLLAAAIAALMTAIGAAPAAAAPLGLDPAFGGGAGWVGTPFSDGAAPDYVKDATTTPDGRIVVVGQAGTNGATGIGIAVYDANGALSPSFSGDGKKTISVPVANVSQDADAVATYPDGRIVIAGNVAYAASNYDIVVAVLKPNGDPDPSFGGGDGLVVHDFYGPAVEFVRDMALDADGDIVVVGGRRDPDVDTMVAVLKPDGSPQGAFNGTGTRAVDEAPGTWDEISAVAVDDAGRYVLAGQSWIGTAPDEVNTLLEVLEPSGQLYNGFSGDGKATADRSEVGRFDSASTVLATPTGYIVGGGLVPAGAVQQYDAFTMRVPLDGVGYTTRAIDLSGGGRDDSYADLFLQGDALLATGGIKPVGGGVSDRDHMGAVLNHDGTVRNGPHVFLMGDTDSFWSGTAVMPAPTLRGGLAGSPLIVAGSLVQGGEGEQFGVARLGIPGSVPLDPPPPDPGTGGGDTVIVTPPPPPPPPAAKTLVDVGLAYGWRAGKRRTRVGAMTLKRLKPDMTVEVRCAGKGCPFKQRKPKVKKATLDLKKLFGRRGLRPGATIEVRVAQPGHITKVFRYVVRKGKVPKGGALCLPDGAPKPTAC